MSEEIVRLYEGLFLINPASIQSDLGAATRLVRELLDRAGASTESIFKWDERKLAYDIEGAKRGLYMLAYFRVAGKKIVSLERDVSLSENVLRCLIVRADHVGETELQLARDAQSKTQSEVNLQSESPAAEGTTETPAAPAQEHAEA